MTINASFVRVVVLRAAACAATAFVAFGSAHASNIEEVYKHTVSAAVDVDFANRAFFFGEEEAGLWFVGWAITQTNMATIWDLLWGQAFNPSHSDPNYALAVNLTLPAFTPIGDADAAYIFGVASVDSSVTSALNSAMMQQMALSKAYAGFQLADRRVIGALNANDPTSAQLRFTQMLAFRDQAIAEIPAARAALLNLSSVAGANGLNIVFTVADLTSIQMDLMANGRSGFGQEYLDELAAFGYTNDQIDDQIISLTLNSPYSGSDLFSTINDELSAYADTQRWLDVILADRAARIPAPPAFFALAAGAMVVRRRR